MIHRSGVSLRSYLLVAVLVLCTVLASAFQFPSSVGANHNCVVHPHKSRPTKCSGQIPLVLESSRSEVPRSSGLFQSVAVVNDSINKSTELSRPMAVLVKAGMIAFIVGMCLALPATLYPQKLLYRLGLIDRKRKERWAVSTGEFCARILLRMFPFCTIEAIYGSEHDPNPQPAIWVCNHTSMLDIFLLMACDKKLRGPKKRPIKIVYWKDLEANPVTALLFRQSGFIPVAMVANKPGEENEYDKGSFKVLLKDVKRAFEEDFDVALLPEGQLNPTPELGLQPVFGGAYTLAKMSRRPIYMMALYGIHKLWHPNPEIGMTVTGRQVKMRAYPYGRTYGSADEFKTTFETVVGQFGATGTDFPEKELESWLKGEAWKLKTTPAI
jgi:1-acyl-sn-glycerol-3-phosphate acyltransferase